MRLKTFHLILSFMIMMALSNSITNAKDLKDCPAKKVEQKKGYVLIKADHKLNSIGIRLQMGNSYLFTTKGYWCDENIYAGATGYTSYNTQITPWLRPVFHFFERWRQAPNADWFSLICTLGKNNKVLIDVGAMLKEKQDSKIIYQAQKTEALYCYANDLPFKYKNNTGAILFKVTQLK